MFRPNENAEHMEILHRFPSRLRSRSQLALNGGRYPWSVTRLGVPASKLGSLS